MLQIEPDARERERWRPWYARLVRWRHPLLVLFVLQQTWMDRSPTDWRLLTAGAHHLVGPAWGDTYVATHGLQAGPPGLLVVRLFDALPGGAGLLAAQLSLGVLGWYLLWQVERWAHAGGVPFAAAARTTLVGVVVLGAWAMLAGGAPHPEDGLVLLTAVGAMRAVQRGRAGRAALLVGLSMAWKPWGVVALPLLLGLRSGRDDGRRAVLAVLGALAVPAICWVPLLLANPDTLHAVSYGFELQPDAALRAVGLALEHVPRWWRTAELSGALVVAMLAARRTGWWAAVAAGCTARLLLDPACYDYYIAGLVLVTAVTERLHGLRPWRTAVLTLSLVWVQVVLPHEAGVTVRFLGLAVVLVSWVVGSSVRGRARSAAAVPVPRPRSAPHDDGCLRPTP